jgi:hypothetical protein
MRLLGWLLLLVYLGTPMGSLIANLHAPRLHCHCPGHLKKHPPGDEPAYGPCETPQALANKNQPAEYIIPPAFSGLAAVLPAARKAHSQPLINNHFSAPETPPPKSNA